MTLITMTHNDTQHYNKRYKDKQFNDTKNYGTWHDDTHHLDKQLNNTKNYGTQHNVTLHKA